MLPAALLIASVFLGQSQPALCVQQGRPRFVEKSATTIPFDPTNNMIVVNAMVNGQGPFRFLLDTGASHYVLRRELAQSLGLQTQGSFRIDVGDKEMTDDVSTEVAELRIGGIL